MSEKKKQYYIVIKGRLPGVYTKWFGTGEAVEQVKDFPGAVYKGFYTREEAVNWLKTFSEDELIKSSPELVDFIHKTTPENNELTLPPVEEFLKAGKVVIFTDGSAIGNPGPGGYGVVMKFREHRKELSGGFRQTTNNRMEIQACIEGLRALKQKSDVVIISDSKYVVESMTKGWVRRWQSNGWRRNDKEMAENIDLWMQMLDLCDRHSVEFRWIKGHNNTKENERCDQLAVSFAQRNDLPADVTFEKGLSEKDMPLFSSLR